MVLLYRFALKIDIIPHPEWLLYTPKPIYRLCGAASCLHQAAFISFYGCHHITNISQFVLFSFAYLSKYQRNQLFENDCLYDVMLLFQTHNYQ